MTSRPTASADPVPALPAAGNPPACRPGWLFVSATADFGGHEVMLLRWLEELVAEGRVRPRLLARADGRLNALAPSALTLGPLPGRPDRRGAAAKARGFLDDARALRGVLKALRPELCIFACGALGSQWPLVALARACGARVLVYVPLLDTFADMGYRAAGLKDAFVRLVYGRVPHGWIAVSDNQAAHFRRWARPRGPVLVLPNTVARDIECAAPRPPLPALPAGRVLRVLVLGRLDAHQKGLDLLIDHLAHAAPQGVAFTLTGDGPYRGTLQKALAHDPRLAGCVRLAPWTRPQAAMAAHDVLLMPSRFEGVPLVMLEALALGLPVVASDLPGTRAYLPPECLFPVGDLDGALAILERLRAPAERDRLAVLGREVFAATASGRAFAAAVTRLTERLDRLAAQPAG